MTVQTKTMQMTQIEKFQVKAMKKNIEKVKTLIETLPYINQWTGKIVVIKYGGSAMIDPEIKDSVIKDIALMKSIGIKPVIVHGGGPAISTMLKKFGKSSSFHQGLRVTDKETMEIVEMVLLGKINKTIVSDIQNHNLNAVGICGKDADTILATKKELPDHFDLGYVGEVSKINSKLVMGLLENDIIPVIAPIGKGEDGESYNINADFVASAIAGALKATKLIYLTDMEGVLEDVHDETSLISLMKVDEAISKIKGGIITGGMIPKVECCINAVQKGVNYVHIINGQLEHSMLLEIFTKQGIGTMFI